MAKTESKDTAAKGFKYTRGDFEDLPVDLKHLTIYLNFTDDRVEATNCLEMVAARDLSELSLDASELEVSGVELSAGPDDDQGEELTFDYLKDENRLLVTLPRKIATGETFFIRTSTTCIPSEHILEGIYRDVTPEGAPQQYISQCQQWGFQRIMPVLDDCRAKCTMTTTIEGDATYTHLISNGNICRDRNPDGKPVLKEGDPGRQVITYDNPIPMSPYIFLVCAGTWDTLADEVTYPSGRRVKLEYLVPPGSVEEARIPMSILKESVLWIGRNQDYEYTFDTYRTICMTKSNFGGMENLGNTTIVTDAALITAHTPDHLLLYAHAVIVHEFEHNQCGSETTMETPFDVWLNEAYTVDVERQFMADQFDPAFVRLNQVESIRSPLLGPLAIEDAGHFGRIVRDGFNEPDELIDGVTYVKAPEVIRMLRLLIGREAFHKGKTLYFDRYRGLNADTDDFFACFEEVTGTSLEGFKREWLYRIGYPKVTATTEYDAEESRYTIKFRQEVKDGTNPFTIPIELALVSTEGKDIEGAGRVFILKEREAELEINDLAEEPAFASINRDYSFYGTFEVSGAGTEALKLQSRLDPNLYNRVDAIRKLTDRVRCALIEDPDAGIDEEWLEIYGAFISMSGLSPAIKAYLLRIDEQPLDRRYTAFYREQVIARDSIVSAVNTRYRDKLLEVFNAIPAAPAAASSGAVSGEEISSGIERRMLKNLLLELITYDDTPESHSLILSYLSEATTPTERVAALVLLNRSSAPERRAVLEDTYAKWHTHLSGYANYLRAVSSGTNEDVFDMIKAEEERPTFDIMQPTWNRALFLSMAANNKMVWTEHGIEWVAGKVIELASINPATAGRLLNTFQHVRILKPELKAPVVKALERIILEVTKETSASINGQASAYLE